MKITVNDKISCHCSFKQILLRVSSFVGIVNIKNWVWFSEVYISQTTAQARCAFYS